MKIKIDNFFKLINFLGIKKKLIIIFLIFFILLSIIEVVSFGLVGTFISIVFQKHFYNAGNNLINDNVSIVDFLYANNSIYEIALILFLLFLTKFLIYIFLNKRINLFVADALYILRSKIIENIFKNSNNRIIFNNKNDLINSLLRHANITCSSFLYYFIKSTSEIITILFLVCFLFYLDWIVTLVAFLLLIIIYLIYQNFIGKQVLQNATMLGDSNESFIDWLFSLNLGFKEIKIYGKEKYFKNKIDLESFNLSNYERKFKDIQIYPRVLIEFFFISLIIGFSILVHSMLSLNSIIIAKFSVFFLILVRILPVYNQLINQMNEINFSQVSVDHIFKTMTKQQTAFYENISKDIPDISYKQSIKIQNLNFSYDKKNQVIKDFSANIPFNKVTGIIGLSGSGKSTLVDLLAGFLDPDKGQIFIDAKNLSKIKSVWQNKIAYIPQSIFLINKTIKENIVLQDVNLKFDKNTFDEAIRISGLNKFVFNNNIDINYTISDNGSNLSGGQKQRISIARAFYHQRKIIIMDEPTSSLDVESKNYFYEYIDSLKGQFTIILVSHDMKIKNICDEIINLD